MTEWIVGLNWADFSIIGIIALSIIISLVRGFVKEAISLTTWIIAALVGLRFSPNLADLFVNQIETPSVRIALAFIILFVIILILGSLINYLVSSLVSRTGLSGTDRLLGVLFGAARGVLLIALIVLFVSQTNAVNDPWWKESQLIPSMQGVAEKLRNLIPEEFSDVSHLVDSPEPEKQ